jgi:hypothetical protein
MFRYATNRHGGSSPTLRGFVRQVDHEIQRGEQVCELLLIFQNFDFFNRSVTRAQCQPLLTWLTTTTTLTDINLFEARQSLMGNTVYQWILRALLNRALTLPAINGIICSGVEMTAEDVARLLQVCRPERLTLGDCTLLRTTLCPTNHEALEHIGTALRGTSSTLKQLQTSAALLSGPLLRGLQNNEPLSLRVRSGGGQNHALMTQEHADTLIELLQQSTGERKQLALVEYRWRGDPVFASLTSAFRESSSYHEIGFEMCTFDAASSRLLCAIFSSPKRKAIQIGTSVVFPSSVLENLAGSSPFISHIKLMDQREPTHLEAIFRGLAMSTSTLEKLYLSTLPVNQLNLLLNALPKFTHLQNVVFTSDEIPLHMKRDIVLAFKRNGCLVESTTHSRVIDSGVRAKLEVYHRRNQYLPMAFESAIEKKTTEKNDSGPGEFLFQHIPSLLQATIVATAASQGPTRVFDVLMRCEDRIGPLDCK